MRYILKKLLMMAFTLVVVSVCVFLAFHIIPGDPATRILGTQGTPQQVEKLREQMGLTDPIYRQYLRWFISFLQGDMGTSYIYSQPVSQMLAGKIPITLSLSVLSFLFMIILSIPLGIYTAKHENSLTDQVIMILNQVIMAIPPFFSGILITYLFGMLLHFFVPGGFVSYETSVAGFLSYLIFPAIAIALPKAAMATKLLRGSVIEEAAKDYTRTAYSRGNTVNGVLYRHVLKNAMIPVITFLGMALADMVAGSIIIEQVFGIPGISRILLTSISNRDYPVVEAVIMGIAMLVILINFLVDILYRVIDPRIGN